MTNHITPYVVKELRRDLADSLQSNSFIQGRLHDPWASDLLYMEVEKCLLFRIMVVMRAKFLVRKWNSVPRGLVEGLPA